MTIRKSIQGSSVLNFGDSAQVLQSSMTNTKSSRSFFFLGKKGGGLGSASFTYGEQITVSSSNAVDGNLKGLQFGSTTENKRFFLKEPNGGSSLTTNSLNLLAKQCSPANEISCQDASKFHVKDGSENKQSKPSFRPKQGIKRLLPIFKQNKCPDDQRIIQAFPRFHLIASDINNILPINGPPAFVDLVHGDVVAAYLCPSENAAGSSHFVPPSFSAILHFCACVDDALAADPSHLIALRVPLDGATVTTAAFFTGAYMLLRSGTAPSEIEARFTSFLALLLPDCALAGEACSHCTAADCWRGLWKSLQLGWLFIPERITPAVAGPPDPFRADVQELVPGKLVVFRGPRALPGGVAWRDVISGDGRPVGRDFSPEHMTGMLRRLGVAAVVRLNAAEYSADAFVAEGLAFADLPVPEGGCPPPAVAAKFLRLLDAVPGAVAAHGGASLGRAGTLAALFAMRRHGFTAYEAAGWLRVVRPGSIAPQQLEYLVGHEAVLRRVTAAGSSEVGGASPPTQMLGPSGAQLPPLRLRRTSFTLPVGCDARPDGHTGRVAEIVAEVVAEVDARMLARETSSESLRARSPLQRVTPDAADLSSGSITRRMGRSGSGMERSSSAVICGIWNGNRSRKWESCPSLTSLDASSLVSNGASCATTASGESPEDGRGCAGQEATAAPLRYCADLLPLPFA